MHLDKQHIQRQFSRAASSYDRVAGMQREIVDDLLALIPAEVFETSLVADLGCGTGYGLQGLQKRCPQGHLVGVDLASGMLGLARQSQPNVSYVQGDIESLPLATEQFGLSFSSSAIQWCQLHAAVAELLRVTKPGAWLALSTFVDGTLSSWRQLWAIDTARRFVSAAEIQGCFADAGMTIIEVALKTYQQHFYSFDEATASIRDLGAGSVAEHGARGLFGRQHYRQVKEKVDEIIARDGSICLPYKVVCMVARKPLDRR